MIDSHCHLQLEQLHKELPTMLDRMEDADVSAAVCICISQTDIKLLQELLFNHPQIYATVGVHPTAPKDEEVDIELIKDTFESHPHFVAIGECGLDRYHNDSPDERQRQEQRFKQQLELALELNKPVIVHTRNSADTSDKPDCIDATMEILQPYCKQGLKAVLHCFTGTMVQVQLALSMGCWISFTGIVTFKSASEMRTVAKNVPLKRLMIETDSPYLAPEPHRGKRNEPTYVRYVAATLAKQHNMPLEDFVKVVTETTRNFYNI